MDEIEDIRNKVQALQLQVQWLVGQVQELMQIQEVEEAGRVISSVLDIKQAELMSRLSLLEQEVKRQESEP